MGCGIRISLTNDIWENKIKEDDFTELINKMILLYDNCIHD